MSNIFFTSDTHYAHSNICRGTSKWDLTKDVGSNHQSTRNFKTLDEMNNIIVQGINNIVGKNDVLYHLGDWSFGGINKIYEFRKQINCENIHLIFGNHDEHIENNIVLPNCKINKDGYIINIEHSGHLDNNIKAKQLFNSTQYVKTIKVANTKIFMSHYAHRIWDKSHHGAIHLYGHSHATLEGTDYGKSMDVGIDNYYRLFGKYEPFNLEQILIIMNERTINFIDHHNQKTN